MTYTSRLPLGGEGRSDRQPEASLDAKLKAMADARCRSFERSLLPDLDSLPRSGCRPGLGDPTGVGMLMDGIMWGAAPGIGVANEPRRTSDWI